MLSKSCGLYFVACLLGAVIWFGMQAFSRRDNFSDQINRSYFLAFYAAAFFIGLIAKSDAIMCGVMLALSQVVCYFIYPNVSRELGNLFPIAAALLLACTAPAALVAFLGARVRSASLRRN